MTTQSDFEKLLADIECEAQAGGPATIVALRAIQMRYRAIARLIQQAPGRRLLAHNWPNDHRDPTNSLSR
ncbi:MAG TPA: hypothetical protein VFZ25_04960 [Chloroflexota bacterium]|nr:hypothetical protein [Chloroflexota bacterium]